MNEEQKIVEEKKETAAPVIKKKSNKKIFIILGAVVVALAIAFFILLEPFKFDSVKAKCKEIGGDAVSPGVELLFIKMPPNSAWINENVEESERENYSLDSWQNALGAVQYANGELGFSDDVLDRIMDWQSPKGSADSGRYSVYWEYQSDGSLLVRYSQYTISDLFNGVWSLF